MFKLLTCSRSKCLSLWGRWYRSHYFVDWKNGGAARAPINNSWKNGQPRLPGCRTLHRLREQWYQPLLSSSLRPSGVSTLCAASHLHQKSMRLASVLPAFYRWRHRDSVRFTEPLSDLSEARDSSLKELPNFLSNLWCFGDSRKIKTLRTGWRKITNKLL